MPASPAVPRRAFLPVCFLPSRFFVTLTKALEQKAGGTYPDLSRPESRFTHELLELMKDLKPRVSPPPSPVDPINPARLRKILREKVDIFGKEDQQVCTAV